VNVDSAGNQANGFTNLTPTISADARLVAFQSAASNLVTGDTNDAWDIFVHDRGPQEPPVPTATPPLSAFLVPRFFTRSYQTSLTLT
jgi:hypothetical protein